ncbi:MAG: DUF3078 domain-containing protein [Bacteroidota bacterium]
MIKKLTLVLLTVFAFSFSVTAQDEPATEEKSDWLIGGGVGLNLDQLLIINPRAGAGENKFGFGGIGNFFADREVGRIAWNNTGSLQLVFQRLGRNQTGNPFQKTIDELRLASKIGYAITDNKKWYAALEGTFMSQLLETFNGNYLKDVNTPAFGNDDGLGALSKFLAPATITLTPGIDWKPNDHFSVLFSPATLRLLVVADESVARLYVDGTGAIVDPLFSTAPSPPAVVSSLHGNPMRGPNDFDKTDVQLGTSLRATYKNTHFNDRISFASGLFIFYDYLGGQDGATNVPVFEWTTETAFNVYKGLSIVLTTGLYYDYNKLVSKDWNKDLGVFETTGHGAMFTQALLIKYNFIIGAKKE